MEISKSMRRALEVAASRERGNLCPVIGAKGRVNAAAETALLQALSKRGLIDASPVPYINDAGRALVAHH